MVGGAGNVGKAGAVLAMCAGRPPIMADWPADRRAVIREPRGYRARAEVLARTTHYQPVKGSEESLEMLNDADCSIDHVITADDVLEHVGWDDLAFPEIHRVLTPGGYFCLQGPYAREKTAIADDPRGAIRFEREWPR